MLADKYLKAKAAETHGLLGFVNMTLYKYRHWLVQQGEEQSRTLFDLLTRAGQAAASFDDVLNRHERVLAASACDELFTHYARFIMLSSRANIPLLPKAHLMFHCIQRARERGNPRAYTTYVDESYNGAIAKVCRSVHRINWSMAVYRKLEMLEALQDRL